MIRSKSTEVKRDIIKTKSWFSEEINKIEKLRKQATEKEREST